MHANPSWPTATTGYQWNGCIPAGINPDSTARALPTGARPAIMHESRGHGGHAVAPVEESIAASEATSEK